MVIPSLVFARLKRSMTDCREMKALGYDHSLPPDPFPVKSTHWTMSQPVIDTLSYISLCHETSQTLGNVTKPSTDSIC